MNLRPRLRIRLRRSEWRAHDRLFDRIDHRHPQAERYIVIPVSKRRNRSRNRTSMEGQTIVLLAFLLLVVLGMLLSSRAVDPGMLISICSA